MSLSRNKKLPMTTLILAGGRSRRMGEDKAFLPLGGGTMVEFLVDRMKSIFFEVTVVTKTPEKFKFLSIPTIEDAEPESSSMVGLYSGLTGSSTSINFVIPCDASFIPTSLIRHMAQFAEAYETVVLMPQGSNEPSPLPGFYKKELIEPLKECLDAKRYELRRFLESRECRVMSESEWRAFDPEGRSFINVNTPSDYRQLREQEVSLTHI